jgi:uncharacterized protein
MAKNMQKRIAISGASGMIGRALVNALESEDIQWAFLQRVGSRSETDESGDQAGRPRANVIAWDPDQGLLDASQLEGFDTIVHLAGRSIDAARWTEKEKQRLRDSRVKATERLVQQIAQLSQKPKLFISASAIGYYGNCGDQLVTESHPAANDDFLGSLAAQWERASQPLSQLGVRLIHARFGVVLSTLGGALGKMIPLFQKGLGGRLGSGEQYWSWISLEDCCRALVFLCGNDSADGAFNLVSPNPVTNAEFTALLGGALGRPTLIPAPKFALRLALGEMADALLLSSCRVQPARLTELGFAFHHPDLKAFLASELKG